MGVMSIPAMAGSVALLLQASGSFLAQSHPAESSESRAECRIGTGAVVSGQDAPMWTIELMAKFKAVGLIIGYPNGLSHSNGRSRYEVAVQTYAVVHQTENLLNRTDLSGEDIQMLVSQEPNWKELIHAIREVNRELDSIGGEPAQLLRLAKTFQARVRRIAAGRAFIDVPSGHWAAEAVRELKDLGILRGYPGGSFKGN